MGDIWEFLTGIGDSMESFVLNLADSLWLYPALFVMSALDGFFPVFPSESALNAISSAWSQADVGILELTNPFLIGIIVAAIIGAWAGDQVAYFIGAHVNIKRLRIFKGDKGQAMLTWARRSLEQRGGALIVGARHVPMGRVIVNLSAGTLHYPYGRFMVMDAIAVTVWALWNISLGVFAGAIFGGNLLLAIAVAITFGISIGFLAEKVLARFDIAPPKLDDDDDGGDDDDDNEDGGDGDADQRDGNEASNADG